MTQRTCLFAMVALLSALVSRDANAEGNVDAKRHYEAGTRAYSVGNFDKAVSEYTTAYEISGDSVLLYNIAQAHRLANNLERAVFFYRSYLRNTPNATNRNEIEERIQTLDTEITKRRAASIEAPPNSPVPMGQRAPAATVEHAVTPTPTTAQTTATMPLTSSALNLTAAPTPAEDGGEATVAATPVYKKWWLWTIVGAVAVVAAGVGVGVASSGGASAPDAHFGTRMVF